MGPIMLGLGFLQVLELLQSILAYWLASTPDTPTIDILGYVLTKPLPEGELVRIDTARRLYQFPMGVLALSLSVAVFPLLSRYAARQDTPNLRAP